MITIHFQETTLTIEKDRLLSEILLQQGYEAGTFAILINRKFIPRSAYAATVLSESDVVEVIAPMQGG
jgi:sulfur carrier protein